MPNVTDGAELLFHVMGQPETLGVPFNLAQLPPKMQEAERKYHLQPQNGHNDGGSLRFAASLHSLTEARRAKIVKDVPFDGIDEYYRVKKSSTEQIVLRYRVGSNRMPQLTMKFKLLQDSNEVRGELNLDVRNNEPETVRALLTAFSQFAGEGTQFAIRQTGLFWVIKDPEVGVVEVVCYRVSGINPQKPMRYFAEVEATQWSEIDTAIHALETYEQGLKLSSQRCTQSIAELFGPPGF